MEHRTSKIHPEFDLAAAKKTYAKVKEELCGEQITSPYDLYSVERLRDEHDLRQGIAFATDVFVLGMGPPQDRRVTKVSGLPYWPKAKPWPTADDGSRYQFLAQFCFVDSRDREAGLEVFGISRGRHHDANGRSGVPIECNAPQFLACRSE